MRHIGRISIPGVAGQHQIQALPRLRRPCGKMVFGPGHDFCCRDQQGRLQGFPAGFPFPGGNRAVDGQIDLIHPGIQCHDDGVGRRRIGHLGRHGLVGHHGQHRYAQAQPHALRRATGHAQPGKAPRALAERHGVQGGRRQP
ncbi:hypothetical protein G6F22_017486 [Rhizopus arrhizus]|nr:hypothetical protein G6F22_017486 [Rhizopus arrhizus]